MSKKKQKRVDAHFDRLCDTSLYTGMHQHRFDETGRGLGLQGRERIVKGIGTHMVRPINGNILDIGQVMRVDLGPFDYTKPKYKKGKAPPIYDKLMDHRFYTGTHKHRFDNNGKGLGFQGRERIIKGVGTVDQTHDGGVIRDIGHIMRIELRTGLLPRPSSTGFLGKPYKAKPCKKKDCEALRHPGSKIGLCSFHMWTEHEEQNYRKPGQGFEAPKLKKKEMCTVKRCGRERAANEKKCAYHKWLAEKESGSTTEVKPKSTAKGKSKSLPKRRPLQCSIYGCQSTRFKLGYCVDHYEKLSKTDADKNAAKWLEEDLSKPKKEKKKKRTKKKKKFTIFDKLNDPSQYTGYHQHRFDKFGRGRGLEGRESIIKGGSGYPKHHPGDTVLDISQLCRPNLH